MEAAAELALRLRAAANDRLARYEPLALVAAPLLALLVARTLHATASAVADRGLVAIAAVKSAFPPSFLLDIPYARVCPLTAYVQAARTNVACSSSSATLSAGCCRESPATSRRRRRR